MRILSTGVRRLDFDMIKMKNPYENVCLNKPGPGVLWGSTLIEFPNGKVSSSWNSFTACDYTDKWYSYGVSFELTPETRIMEIDSIEKYFEYMRNYKIATKNGYAVIDRSMWNNEMVYALNFNEIQKDFDAFHLTYEAFRSLRLCGSDELYKDFYSYDAESWIIFNPYCIDKDSILYHANVADEENVYKYYSY